MCESDSRPGLCVNCNKRPKHVENGKTHSFCGKYCAQQAEKSTMCLNCKQRPKHMEGGKDFLYCSKYCAAQRVEKGTSKLCLNCNQRPRYYDSTRKVLHEYCGRTCARAASDSATLNSVPSSPRSLTARDTPSVRSSSVNQIAIPTCIIPDCILPRDPDIGGCFCSEVHLKLGIELDLNGCIVCLRAIRQKGSPFCSKSCIRDAVRDAPSIVNIARQHTMFKDVENQFVTSWKHPTNVPDVQYIYRIICSSKSVADYEEYRQEVEAKGNHVAEGRKAGNETRRFHGTQRECLVGDDPDNGVCRSDACSMCCIIRSSFDISCFGKQHPWGRFGKGIYTSSVSSKSNDYSSNRQTSKFKAMLLNKVVVGRGKKLTQDSPLLTEPPNGFDSVIGEVTADSSLNYDELVVYDNNAIRPVYLIVYEPKP